MLQLVNITKGFAGQSVLDQVDWHLRPGERVGLCGENGAGKTTLLRLLAGQYEPDAGTIQVARGTLVGYLPQDGLEHRGRTLFAEACCALDHLQAIEAELKELEARISTSHLAADLDRYAQLQEEFLQRGGFTMEADVARVLRGLGFSEADREKPCEHFSGGWQMRIALAKLLLRRPNLLLLDEPTNPLDLPARDWLEEYLAGYPFTVVLVSHDRFFLDRVVTRIVEVWHGRLTDYPGDYTRYLAARSERLAALREAKRRQDEEIARIEAFINKFRYNNIKAPLVQSRIKQLEKIERIDLPPERRRIAFSFPAPPKGGRLAVQLAGVGHGYGGQPVLTGVDLTIERGDRVALVGANGAGKSTLMRLLAGVEVPLGGRREEGLGLVMAYFAQDQAQTLDPQLTVLEQITRAAPVAMVPQLRNLLGAFLFHGDDVHKRVAVLSGGERNRLALAILLLRPANLLLLDEPTNHLDLAAKEVLLEALRGYRGTLVFVSHDRYFVDALATRVVEVDQGTATPHLGNYEDFLRTKGAAGDTSHSRLRVEQHTGAPVPALSEGDRDERRQAHAARKSAQRESQRRERQAADLEARIADLEGQMTALDEQMHDPQLASDHAQLAVLAARRQALQGEHESCCQRWLTLQEEIEAAG